MGTIELDQKDFTTAWGTENEQQAVTAFLKY